jgi:hypothetical protein
LFGLNEGYSYYFYYYAAVFPTLHKPDLPDVRTIVLDGVAAGRCAAKKKPCRAAGFSEHIV